MGGDEEGYRATLTRPQSPFGSTWLNLAYLLSSSGILSFIQSGVLVIYRVIEDGHLSESFA
jgi:hypothetical protein